MKFNENIKKLDKLFIISTLTIIFTQNFYWLTFFIGYFIYLSISNHSTTNKIKLDITRNLNSSTVREGQNISVKLEITNKDILPFHGEVVDIIPNQGFISDGANINLIHLDSNETTTINYNFYVGRRGKYSIGPIECRSLNYPITKEIRYTNKKFNEIIVVPNPEIITEYNLKPYLLTSVGGYFSSKLVGEGIDFTGIREYQYTDSLNRINWKASAKFNQMYSNEFEIERSTNMIIVLDLTEESEFIADSSVRAALGLVTFLMHKRIKVGLITLGKYINYIPVKSGKRHLIEITEHLTNVDTIKSIKEINLFKLRLTETLKKINKSSNDVILFSSLNRSENSSILSKTLNKIGKIIVFSPTGITSKDHSDNKLYNLAENILNSRKNTIRLTLNKIGIKIYEWSPDLPFENSLKYWR